MSVIKRRLSEDNYERAKDELGFLVDHLGRAQFRGDLAIEFRGPSELSVYDRGFRLAQIMFARDGSYRVGTHTSFIQKTPLDGNPRFPAVIDDEKKSATFAVTAGGLRSLLQTTHIARMRTRIKEVRHREEIGVSHVIAADTMNGGDIVIIDREVGHSGSALPGERLDLLALERVRADEYRFLAVEVKLGNNPELNLRAAGRNAVMQVEGYRDEIDRCFDDYKECYEENVRQKIGLRLLDCWEAAPTIVRGTNAMLVVAGYMGIAAPHLEAIEREHKDLWVKKIRYDLNALPGAPPAVL